MESFLLYGQEQWNDGGIMKYIMRVIGLSIIGLLMVMTVVYSGERVICDVTVLTDHSADIKLMWTDDEIRQPIMITSWKFIDEETLVVYYETGVTVTEGFDRREIRHESYVFPMKVFVQEVTQEEPIFSDISKDSNGYESIMNLYYRGIVGGYPDGEFKVDHYVTRAEFSKMLLLTAQYEVEATLGTTFDDVPKNHWGRAYIMTLASKEILKGRGEGEFDPEGQITIGEVLTVLSRTFEMYQVGDEYPYTLKEHWSNVYFKEMVSQGLVVASDAYYNPYSPDDKATRYDCVVLLSRVLGALHDVAE